MNNKVDSTSIHQKMIEDDVQYHAQKLGLGEHGVHEGWIKAEEVGAAAKMAGSTEARHKMIAVAAYYLAEKRGLASPDALEDWVKAETEIDMMLDG